jgi:hypothetical protein
MTVETREDGFIKNAKTNRWLKPGSRSFIAYMKEHGDSSEASGNVAMEPIEPVQSQPETVQSQPKKGRKAKAPLEIAPELSDDEVHTTLTESDFKSALDIVQQKLKGIDSFQPIQVEQLEAPKEAKTRKPRKPRVKKEAN